MELVTAGTKVEKFSLLSNGWMKTSFPRIAQGECHNSGFPNMKNPRGILLQIL